MRLTPMLCALLLLASGCSKCSRTQSSPPPTPSASASAGPTPVIGSVPRTPVGPADLPTPEDYEAEASQRITPSNVKPALDEVEREVNADEPGP